MSEDFSGRRLASSLLSSNNAERRWEVNEVFSDGHRLRHLHIGALTMAQTWAKNEVAQLTSMMFIHVGKQM